MKLLSINLWYEKYRNKTNAQLASFRLFGYSTDVAVITGNNGNHTVKICSVTDSALTRGEEQSFGSYRSAFRFLFDWAIEQKYDLIYIRRLMSKLFYAAPFIRAAGRIIPIVYEIPTFPLDTNETMLYRLRDLLEMKLYSTLNDSIALTAVILRQDMELPDNWISFHNGIDISGYRVTPVPELSNEIRFIIIANMAEWHRYDRMIHSMKKYDGPYKLHLTVIAPENNTVSELKHLAEETGLNDRIDFKGQRDILEIREISKTCHIGIGQLSWSTDCSSQINTLKTKEYCAMGLPFVLSCRDTSFDSDYPYAYLLKNMDDELDLEDVIKWYEDVHRNPGYRQEMYDYAKENLQFHELAEQIRDKLKQG